MLKKITSIMISLSMLASASAAFAVPDAADGESMGPAGEAGETGTPADVPSLTLKKRKNSLYIAQWCRLQAVEI